MASHHSHMGLICSSSTEHSHASHMAASLVSFIGRNGVVVLPEGIVSSLHSRVHCHSFLVKELSEHRGLRSAALGRMGGQPSSSRV